ncbi:MAG TPA: hypothetical protein EYQ42_10680 [Thiotrichaceae bacterium]|jgi:hypothetical protein|nr:hypothetical protein [Thiotrichaceae bacterium]HIM07265.1 hypothetical protein [Gammaproteobacteria bacterium]
MNIQLAKLATMKIRTSSTQKKASERRRNDLLDLLSQDDDKQRRPCPDCHTLCKCDKHSSHCTCGCSVDCKYAPRMLSSDPDLYPIESNVVPLVYAMSVLRVAEPCWSCEGHLKNDNELLRPPQVWFYSDSTVYPELISEYLHDLCFIKETSCLWTVMLCQHTASHATTFSIKPEISEEVKITSKILRQLQNDLHVISYSLREKVFKLAEK